MESPHRVKQTVTLSPGTYRVTSTPWYTLHGEDLRPHKLLGANVHGSDSHNGPKVQTTQMSIGGLMDIWNVAGPPKAVLLSLKKEMTHMPNTVNVITAKELPI